MAKQLDLFAGRNTTSPDRAERKPFYSSARWRKLRRMMLRENPVCQCGEIDEATGELCQRAANEIHHIIDLAKAPELAYTMSNLKCLSKVCHSRETARRQAP